MDFKEIKKTLLASEEHKEWFKTVEIGFSSYPCDFHKKFIGIEQFYIFLKTELSDWLELSKISLPGPLETSRKYISQVFEDLNSNLEALTESRNSQDHVSHVIANKVTSIQNELYIAKSPESFFLIKLDTSNTQAVDSAHKYFSRQLNYSSWTNDHDALIGVMAAYEFSSGEQSHIFSRRSSEKKVFSKLRSEFDKEIDAIIQIKESKTIDLEQKIAEFEKSINEIRTRQNDEHHKHFSKVEGENNKIQLDATNRILELESLYTDKLMLEKPVEYWDKRAIDLKNSSTKWMWAAIGTSIVGLIIFVVLALSLTPESLEKHIKNPAVSIRWSILSILAIALIVFLVKTFTKLTMSSYHLYRDAQERKQLTYLYLSLKSETQIPDTDRHIILQSLFSRSDTGLLKEDSGPTMPISMLDRIKN